MILIYDTNGDILAAASSANENGKIRELSKDEVFKDIVGESLVIQDDQQVLAQFSKYQVKEGKIVLKYFKKIILSGISDNVPAGSKIDIDVEVSNKWSGTLKINVSRGKLSAREIEIKKGIGSFSWTVPDETIDLSLYIMTGDSTVDPIMKKIQSI